MINGLLEALKIIEAQENQTIKMKQYYSDAEFEASSLTLQKVKLKVQERIDVAKLRKDQP